MNDVTKFENMYPALERPMSALEIKAQVQLIQEVLREVMIADVHYGYPPGTAPKNDEDRKTKKPSLYKPGAEKLCLVFRMDPQYDPKIERDGNHLSVTSTCLLYSISTGKRIGSGMGSATTRESKHAYRWSSRKCPSCNAEAIIKGREEYGGGWLCFARKGGCGAKFNDGDPSIEQQHAGKVENPDVADQHNTVLKMANKRALVAAVLTATAASDIFNQDIEDLGEEAEWIDSEGVVHKGAKPKDPVKGVSAKAEQQRQPSEQDAKPLSEGAKKTLRAALDRAKRTETDLSGAGFPKIDEMPFAKFNEAMDWIKKNPGA